jgi:hypothetical protein
MLDISFVSSSNIKENSTIFKIGIIGIRYA